jgi:hypothetical protein
MVSSQTSPARHEPGAIAELQLCWHGPYSFFGDVDRPSVTTPEFVHKNAKGVYLWTIQTDGGHYISYAGKTGRQYRAFATRFNEHIKWTLDGGEGEVLDPVELRAGRIKTYAEWRTTTEFRADPKLRKVVEKALRCFAIFVCPINEPSHIPLIEGAIIRRMRMATGKAAEFFANKTASRTLLPFRVQFVSSPNFHGLGTDLECHT